MQKASGLLVDKIEQATRAAEQFEGVLLAAIREAKEQEDEDSEIAQALLQIHNVFMTEVFSRLVDFGS